MTSPQENANGVNGTARLADPQKTVTCPSTPAAANGKPATAARNTTARINGHVIGAVATMENAGNGSGVIQPNSASSLPATPPTSASQADTMAEQITPTEAQNDQGSSAEQDDKTAHGEDGKRDLYVGNLHPRVQPHMLRDLFGGEGKVENVKIVPDRNLSHGGLGYGFVTMTSHQAAEAYLQSLQNINFFGLELRINWATPTKSAEQGLALFVGDIGPDVSVEELRAAFLDDETMHVEARIVMDPSSGRTKGYGFVTFPDTESATKALSKNGEILKGRKMRVNWASTTKDQKPPSMPANPVAPQIGGAPVPPGPGHFMGPIGVPDPAFANLVRNDVHIHLSTMAQMEGLDVGWYLRLPPETQNGIIRVSKEAAGARVVWIGNLDKTTTQHDLMPLFSVYGLVEEITMVSASGFAFVSMVSHLAAATIIVIFKEHPVKGRKIKTGWSHNTQRQLQQASAAAAAAAAAAAQQQLPPPQHIGPQTSPLATTIPPHHVRPQPMQPGPQMTTLPPMPPQQYIYPGQPPYVYHPFLQPIHPYPQPMMPPPPPNGTGASTPRSTTSGGSATPATAGSTYTEPRSRDTPSSPSSR